MVDRAQPDDGRHLELSVAEQDGSATVAANGELDIHTSVELERVLLQLVDDQVKHVTVDLEGVTFIDSAGLRALVVGHNALEQGGGTLQLQNPSPMASRLLSITGLNDLFGVEDTTAG